MESALEILRATDPGLLAEAQFDPDLLDELALDVRAYDHGHPVNRRPNYVFGEWDPHHIDNQGRYRRYVAREDHARRPPGARRSGRRRPTAATCCGRRAAVLAGTMLMATGVSGAGPSAHDSATTLAVLLPRIARYRDAFYEQWLRKRGGDHGDRLRQEAGGDPPAVRRRPASTSTPTWPATGRRSCSSATSP